LVSLIIFFFFGWLSEYISSNMPFLKLSCPGIDLRVRPQPTFDCGEIGLLHDGSVIEVCEETYDGFYRFVDGSGYIIMGDDEEIFYHPYIPPMKSSPNLNAMHKVAVEPEPQPVQASTSETTPEVVEVADKMDAVLSVSAEPAAEQIEAPTATVTVAETSEAPSKVVEVETESEVAEEQIASVSDSTEPEATEPAPVPPTVETTSVSEPVAADAAAAAEDKTPEEPPVHASSSQDAASPPAAPTHHQPFTHSNESIPASPSPSKTSNHDTNSPTTTAHSPREHLDPETNPLAKFMHFELSDMDYTDRTK
jgi:hypothetical protein